MTTNDDFSQAIRVVADRIGPAVVRIGAAGGRGCGIVVAPGTVVTNAHNLRGGETTVTFADGRAETATVTAADVDGDLAVLEVDTADAAAPEWADGEPGLGDVVVAVARNAAGGLRVTSGAVSGADRAFRGPRGRRISGSIEHTAPLLRGSSGSPIADAAGRLVGINTNRLGDGFYLAVPAGESLRQRLDDLRRGEVPSRVVLGVGLAPAAVARRLRRAVGLPERDGLLVRLVEDESPAEQAGIRAGDLLVDAGGRPLRSADDLYDVLDGVTDGTLVLQVVRGTDEVEVTVDFAQGAGE